MVGCGGVGGALMLRPGRHGRGGCRRTRVAGKPGLVRVWLCRARRERLDTSYLRLASCGAVGVKNALKVSELVM